MFSTPLWCIGPMLRPTADRSTKTWPWSRPPLSNYSISTWISLYRQPHNWVDGNPSTFRNWLKGEPNGDGYCVSQRSDYYWDNDSCDKQKQFICKKGKIHNSKEYIIVFSTRLFKSRLFKVTTLCFNGYFVDLEQNTTIRVCISHGITLLHNV